MLGAKSLLVSALATATLAGTLQKRFTCNGGFADSCWDLYVSGSDDGNGMPLMHTSCRTNSGTTRLSEFYLNGFLGNDNGQLVRRDQGNFGYTCAGCEVSTRGWLACNCAYRGAGANRATYNLNALFCNHDGYIATSY